MSLIVAARFGTFEQAENAAQILMDKGFSPDSLQLFFVNPAGAHDRYPVGGDYFADPASIGAQYGAVGGAAAVGVLGAFVGAVITFTLTDSLLPIIGGAGVGAYIGSLAGALYILGRVRPRALNQPELAKERSSGVVLAVHVELETERQAASVLRDAGGIEVERAQGRWVNGRWEDFDPLIAPELKKDF
ncbi:MAG TPA: hypothetical protein VIP51_00815 [Eoetvoesiella sp.]